jgi:hypothetical protein
MSKITIREKYEKKWSFFMILLLVLSSIITLTTILGSLNGKIFIDKLYFDDDISKFIQVKSVSFTMYGYCIDDNCTNNVIHDFDIGK